MRFLSILELIRSLPSWGPTCPAGWPSQPGHPCLHSPSVPPRAARPGHPGADNQAGTRCANWRHKPVGRACRWCCLHCSVYTGCPEQNPPPGPPLPPSAWVNHSTSPDLNFLHCKHPITSTDFSWGPGGIRSERQHECPLGTHK